MTIESASRVPFFPGDVDRQRGQGKAARMSLLSLRCMSVVGLLVLLGAHVLPDITKQPGLPSKASLEGYTGVVYSLQFDSIGEVLASVGFSGVTRLWDVAKAREIGHRWLSEEQVFCAAFSPDGRTLATGGRNDVAFWDVSKEEESERRLPLGEVRDLVFSPDGKSLLTADYQGVVRLWDKERGSLKAEYVTHQPGLIRLKFAPDGFRWAVICPDHRVRVWKKVEAGSPTSYPLPGGDYFAMTFSRNAGRLFAGSRAGYIQSFELATGAPGRRYEVGGWIRELAVSPDGRQLAIGREDGSVSIMDLATERICKVFREHSFGISALAFSGDGRWLASGSSDSIIKIWDLS